MTKKQRRSRTFQTIFSGNFILAMGRGTRSSTDAWISWTIPRLRVASWTGSKMNKVDSATYATLLDSPETNAENDSAYSMGAVREVLGDEAHRWTYPVPEEKVLFSLRGRETKKTLDRSLFRHEFSARYIGSPKVKETDRIRGFSEAEMEQMDRTGIVKDVRDNTIFLTFDDWGRMLQSIICSMSFASITRREPFSSSHGM